MDNEYLAENTITKLARAGDMLGGRLTLGGVPAREPISREAPHDIGSLIRVTKSTQEAMASSERLQSTSISAPFADDGGVSCVVEFPESATIRDKHRTFRRATSGFARTNIRTVADMNALSSVTYGDYLELCATNMNSAEYALTWISALTGLDVSRSLRAKRLSRLTSLDDRIWVDAKHLSLEYNVLRRRDRDDPSRYESAGRMQLPIPERVHSGLLQIIEEDRLDEYVSQANAKARKFSKSHAGLTPTLNRLRASTRVFVAPTAFTELEFCAVSGRVPPALQAISTYYPHRRCDVVEKFCRAYDIVIRKFGWNFQDSIKMPRSSQSDVLFCKPSVGTSAVSAILADLAEIYSRGCSRIADLGPLLRFEDVIPVLNVHETACYVVQQLAIGLRPIGVVGNCVIQPDTLSAMIQDKSSMTSAERSYSPICVDHARLIECSDQNREILRNVLRLVGNQLLFEDDVSSLSCEFHSADPRSPVLARRLTNHYLRHESRVAMNLTDIARQPNWIRHVATEYVGGAVPQWMADELFGHMRIGRQPMATWSTAGSSHVSRLREHLQSLLAATLDSRLLVSLPVPTALKQALT